MNSAGAGSGKKKSGTGAGAGASAAAAASSTKRAKRVYTKPPSVDTFKAAIRYVLNMGENTTIDDFSWKVHPEDEDLTVYRGQCSSSRKDIPRRGSNPREISTTLRPIKPISTSKVLSKKIIEFACPAPDEEEGGAGAGAGAGGPPKGRLFKIKLLPGVHTATMYDQIPYELRLPYADEKDKAAVRRREEAQERITPLLVAAFEFLPDELPEGHAYKRFSAEALYGRFFQLLAQEKEVLLDPRTLRFIHHTDGEAESWGLDEIIEPLVKTNKRGKVVKKKAGEEEEKGEEGVSVYPTVAAPKPKEGGGRRKSIRNPRRKQPSGTRRHARKI